MLSRVATLSLLLLFSAATLLACGGDDGPSFTSSSGSGAQSQGGHGGSAFCGPASEAISVQTSTGELHGTLQLPDACGPFPLALIHVGSGPTDRDGNTVGAGTKNDSLKLLAAGLSERGVATLRYDKRGIAASASAAPAESELRFETYVDDLVDWVTLMRGDARFSTVSLVGHSEGSLLAILAAQTQPPDSLVSLAGAGRPAGDVLREQLAKNLTGTLLDEANAIIDQLEMGNTVANVSTELQSLFRPSVQPYLISWFKYDPAVEIAKLGMPLLIAQGTTDIQVSVSDAQLLAAGNPSAELALIEGMNHVLKEATLDQASQQAAYTDPSLPVMPQLFDAMLPYVQP